MRQAIFTDKAPKPHGPKSQAVKGGGLLFISGQLGINLQGEVVSSDVADQTSQAMQNIRAILEADGLTCDDIVRIDIFITDIKHFPVVNTIYQSYFKDPLPTKTAVVVKELYKEAKVEITAIAVYP